MKVKIKNKVYDGAKEPIMVILTSQDKINIANMLPTATKYAQFPDELKMTKEEMIKWMSEQN